MNEYVAAIDPELLAAGPFVLMTLNSLLGHVTASKETRNKITVGLAFVAVLGWQYFERQSPETAAVAVAEFLWLINTAPGVYDMIGKPLHVNEAFLPEVGVGNEEQLDV